MAQAGRIFTASGSGPAELDHALRRKLAANNVPRVIVGSATHGNVANLCGPTEAYGKRQRALIFQRQLASGVLGGAIEPQLIFRDIDDSVIEQRYGCGSATTSPRERVRTSAISASIPAARSKAIMRLALSLQSPKRRA